MKASKAASKPSWCRPACTSALTTSAASGGVGRRREASLGVGRGARRRRAEARRTEARGGPKKAKRLGQVETGRKIRRDEGEKRLFRVFHWKGSKSGAQKENGGYGGNPDIRFQSGAEFRPSTVARIDKMLIRQNALPPTDLGDLAQTKHDKALELSSKARARLAWDPLTNQRVFSRREENKRAGQESRLQCQTLIQAPCLHSTLNATPSSQPDA